MNIQTVFLALLGVVIFVIGTTHIRAYLRQSRPGNILGGKVLSAKLVEKRDKEERLIQHYYELVVQCTGGGKTFQEKIKSTTQYEKGDAVKLVRNGDRTALFSEGAVTFGSALAITLAGMGLAVFPVVYQRNGERDGSIILILLLLLAGVIAISSYLRDRRKKLTDLQGEIIDILYYRRGENKKFSKPAESYYPLIKCTVRDKEKVFLSAYNSSTKGAYKAGAKVKLFYDEEQGNIVEKKASPVLAALAVIFWLMALAGIVSVIG